ncbi:hypothetical protein KY285_019242 [Solanum tuberosum]|nr:hypothetical protein KY285_019242 [Solanum tuberosum]
MRRNEIRMRLLPSSGQRTGQQREDELLPPHKFKSRAVDHKMQPGPKQKLSHDLGFRGNVYDFLSIRVFFSQSFPSVFSNKRF